MSEKLNYGIEYAKLKATYWNGIAIATAGVGALPFILGITGGMNLETGEMDWRSYGISAVTAIMAFGFSRLFHTLALRAIYKASKDYA